MNNSWPIVRLGEICRPKQHPTVSMNELKSQGYPVYGANGQIGFYNSYTHMKKTIAITCRGATCGTVNVVPPFSYITGNAMALDDLDEARVDLLYLALALRRRGLREVISGSAQPQITKQPLLDVRIVLPPPNEQRRIAAILDKANDLRLKRVEAIKHLGALGPAIYADMFGDWRFASKWPLTPLGSRLDFLTSGSRGWAEYYRDSGGRFLRIQNVKHDELDLSDLAFVEAPSTAEARRTRVKAGDVLLSITADLGRTGVAPDDIGEAYINQHLAILRTSKVAPRFLSAALASPAGQVEILRKNREGVKAGLNFDDVRSIRIPDAPLSEQQAFSTRMSEVDKLKCAYQIHLTKLDALFASLEDRAFNGELTSIDAERELAIAG